MHAHASFTWNVSVQARPVLQTPARHEGGNAVALRGIACAEKMAAATWHDMNNA